jgi:peptide/nickel transport system permease protein
MLFPGLTLVLTVLAFNVVGDAIQDALMPRARRRRAPAEAGK